MVGRLTAIAAGVALGLGLSAPAMAAETREEELSSLFRCAAGMGLFDALSHRQDSGATEADKALLGQLTALEPQLRARADSLSADLGPDALKPVIAATRTDMGQRVEPFRKDPQAPRKILEAFRPVLKACVIRGEALAVPDDQAGEPPPPQAKETLP
ncbi:MAG: hypothetical protein Q8L66_00330 [Caulobacter sp.]|nr:hypothetical protein [Caulobacter sp.]